LFETDPPAVVTTGEPAACRKGHYLG
jgi:hypothetical protein